MTLVEGSEVLGGEVGSSMIHACEDSIDVRIVKDITVWVNKYVDSIITNCYLIILHSLSELTPE